MSNEDSYKTDVSDFIKSLGDHLKASPNENQSILAHILKQIEEGAKFQRARSRTNLYSSRSLSFLEVFRRGKGNLETEKGQ